MDKQYVSLQRQFTATQGQLPSAFYLANKEKVVIGQFDASNLGIYFNGVKSLFTPEELAEIASLVRTVGRLYQSWLQELGR